MSDKRGWWYGASTEQRLAQIDAAIELGMTAKQCAMNCGCLYDSQSVRPGDRVHGFASYHGRHFNGESTGKRTAAIVRSRRNTDLKAAKQAYLSGEPVDMWSVE